MGEDDIKIGLVNGCMPATFKGTFIYHGRKLPRVERVVFNDPATVVMWSDGTKTVVKSHNEPFDPEKGLAMCFAKKALGNKGSYYETFKRWLPGEVASC